jgi:repressor of nif and glnA expression
MLTNMVLSKHGSFTCKEIVEEVRSNSVEVNERAVEKALERLRDNDYLEEVGYSYRVIPQKESVRWS